MIQAKHHINPGNLTDSSVDLWKTLKIWAEKTQEDPKFPLDTKLLIITTQSANDGSIASKLKENERDEKNALIELEKVANSSKNTSTKPSRDVFMNLTQESRKALVSGITIYDISPNLTDVRTDIEEELHFCVKAQHLNTLIDCLEGWWWNIVGDFLIGKRTTSISVLEIRKKVDEISELFKSENLPLLGIDNICTPSLDDLEDHLFIQQMRLIDIPDTAINRGIQDYYKSKTQRSLWARESLLLDGENDQYDQKLIDKLERKSEETLIKYSPSNNSEKVKCGQNLFLWAAMVSEPFRNRNELWLSAGGYQALADCKKIGWHPDYKTLLKNSENKEIIKEDE